METTVTAAEKLNKIQTHLAVAANKVLVATAWKATLYSTKHIGMFKVAGTSLYVQRGKVWDCIDYCAIRFGTKK